MKKKSGYTRFIVGGNIDFYQKNEYEFVKGMHHIEGREIIELYVGSLFQNEGIGAKLIEFAIQRFNVQRTK